jgi:hypothetical protein
VLSNVFAIDDLLALDNLSPRERATKIFGLLRTFLDIPAEARTAALAHLTESIPTAHASTPRSTSSGRTTPTCA